MQAIDHQSQRSRTAVITGAGSAEGIGFASARSLGLRGATIIITSTTARIHDRLEELRAQGITALGVCGDLTDPAEAQRLLEIALAHTGRVDILVNNAGMSSISNSVNAAKLSDLSDTDWQAAIASNLTGRLHHRPLNTPLPQPDRHLQQRRGSGGIAPDLLHPPAPAYSGAAPAYTPPARPYQDPAPPPAAPPARPRRPLPFPVSLHTTRTQ